MTDDKERDFMVVSAALRRTSQSQLLIAENAALIGSTAATPNCHAGRICIVGARVTLSQILAELSESGVVGQLADRFDLNPKHIRLALQGLAAFLDK